MLTDEAWNRALLDYKGQDWPECEQAAGNLRADRGELVEARRLLSSYAQWHADSHAVLDTMGVARMTDERAPRPLFARIQDACTRLAEADRERGQYMVAQNARAEAEAHAQMLLADLRAVCARHGLGEQHALHNYVALLGMALDNAKQRTQQAQASMAALLQSLEHAQGAILDVQCRMEMGEADPQMLSPVLRKLSAVIRVRPAVLKSVRDGIESSARRTLMEREADWEGADVASLRKALECETRLRVSLVHAAERQMKRDAEREALGRATAAILQRYRAVPMGGGVLLKEDADQALEQARAAGWL